MSEKSMHKHSGTDWDRLRAMRDTDIEFDEDSPRTCLEDWEDAKITLNNRYLGKINSTGSSHTPSPESLNSLNLPKEVLAYFKATGPGWQTRIEEVLMEWIRTHPLV